MPLPRLIATLCHRHGPTLSAVADPNLRDREAHVDAILAAVPTYFSSRAFATDLPNTAAWFRSDSLLRGPVTNFSF